MQAHFNIGFVMRSVFRFAKKGGLIRCLVACLLGLSLWTASLASTQSPGVPAPDRHISLPLAPGKIDISNRFFAAADPSTTQTVGDMMGAEFTPVKGVFVAGYSAKAHWLKFTISDPAARTREWWLEMEPPFIDQVDLYESLGPDATGKAQFRHVKTGDMQPFSSREVPNQSFVFQLSPKAEPTTYYLRLQSSGPIWVGARLWHSSVFAGYSVRYAHVQAAAFGAFMLLMLITLVQGLVFKDPVYLAFVAHVGVVLLAQASIIFPLHLPDNWYRLVDILPTAATCLSVATYAIFCNYFVITVEKTRLYQWLFFSLTIIGVASAIACISPAFRWIVPAILAAKIVGAVLPVMAVSRRLMRGSWYDRLVWLGLVMYVPAQALLLWRLASVAQQDAFWNTLHIYTGVLLIHMLLITFALGQRVSRITRASQELQDQLGTQRMLKELADRTAFDQRSFLSMVAHELRGPLATARSAADSLRQSVTPPNQAVLTRIERMDTSLQQMASLIAVCLTHEREGFAQPLSLNLRMTLASLRTRLQGVLSDAVAARVLWPDNLDDEPIVCNPALLTIAVRNMIENACRYDTSGAPVNITWQVQCGDADALDKWRISVLDRGPGIPPERLNQLFEPFARADHQDNSGLGLGLYIVSRIASMHGAKTKVQPREGGGMAFSVAFGI
jgi:two-component system, sensor histidine kinase LadS